MKRIFIILSFIMAAWDLPAEQPEGPVIVGAVETVYLFPPGLSFSARIDTGAALSSLGAYDLQSFPREGQLWVRFELCPEGGNGQTVELPVTRVVKIRQGSRSELLERYIVILDVQMANRQLSGEFSLADRRGMDYPVLIGRNLLAGNALVDVAR